MFSRIARHLLSCEEIHPTGIPKYGAFSTPQDENAVLLRSK
jgi:hypothetical protein